MRIPQELVDVVFAHLVDRDDRQTFRNCALAGKPLLPGARTRLFSRITFDDYHTPFQLEQLPLNDIAPYVKEVVYFAMTNASVFDVLASLPNLKDVAFHEYYITTPIIRCLSVVFPLNIRGLTLKSVTFEDLSVAFRFLSLFTAGLTRFSLFGMGLEQERLGETQFTHQVTDGHTGKVSVQNLELSSFGRRSRALLLNDRSPLCVCHLKTLQLTVTLSDTVLTTLRELLNASQGSLTQLRIVSPFMIGEPAIPHNVGLPLRLGHLKRITISIPQLTRQAILLQWLSHAFSGVEGGNLEQLHITILLRNAFRRNHKGKVLNAGYWRGLDVALSAKSVPYLRSVHVRLEYSSSAVSIVPFVRDDIRSACEGLEQRQLLSFELDGLVNE